jgi:hypothetical protein
MAAHQGRSNCSGESLGVDAVRARAVPMDAAEPNAVAAARHLPLSSALRRVNVTRLLAVLFLARSSIAGDPVQAVGRPPLSLF